MLNGLKNIYGWTAFLTMLLGVIVTILFGAAFLIGGQTGEQIAVFAGTSMGWGIRLAAISIAIGLVYTYVKKDHSLTIKSESMDAADEEINKANTNVETAQ